MNLVDPDWLAVDALVAARRLLGCVVVRDEVVRLDVRTIDDADVAVIAQKLREIFG